MVYIMKLKKKKTFPSLVGLEIRELYLDMGWPPMTQQLCQRISGTVPPSSLHPLLCYQTVPDVIQSGKSKPL